MFGYILLALGVMNAIYQLYNLFSGGAKSYLYIFIGLAIAVAFIYFGYRMEFSVAPVVGGKRRGY
jgi:hypothetical protein